MRLEGYFGGVWIAGHCRQVRRALLLRARFLHGNNPSSYFQREMAPSLLVFSRILSSSLGSSDNISLQIQDPWLLQGESLGGPILCCNTCGLWLSPGIEDVVQGGWNNLEVTNCLVAMGTRGLSQVTYWWVGAKVLCASRVLFPSVLTHTTTWEESLNPIMQSNLERKG